MHCHVKKQHIPSFQQRHAPERETHHNPYPLSRNPERPLPLGGGNTINHHESTPSYHHQFNSPQPLIPPNLKPLMDQPKSKDPFSSQMSLPLGQNHPWDAGTNSAILTAATSP